jgi:hypothetical protein
VPKAAMAFPAVLAVLTTPLPTVLAVLTMPLPTVLAVLTMPLPTVLAVLTMPLPTVLAGLTMPVPSDLTAPTIDQAESISSNLVIEIHDAHAHEHTSNGINKKQAREGLQGKIKLDVNYFSGYTAKIRQ